MVRPPVSVSPIAQRVVEAAEARQSGTLRVGRRCLEVRAGALVEVTPSPTDSDIGEFLLRSGRLTPEQRQQLQLDARQHGHALIHSLSHSEWISSADLRSQVRALWLDRLTRALRMHALQPLEADAWTDATSEETAPYPLRVQLIPILLDALSRVARHCDTAAIEEGLDQRLVWAPGFAGAQAVQWAAFGQIPDKPRIGGLLAKLPACAPQVAALVQAGVATLEEPEMASLVSDLPLPLALATLGPPPARLSNIPAQLASMPPRLSGIPAHLQPKAADPEGARLRPGGDGDDIEDIPRVSLPRWPRQPKTPLLDPLRDVESELQECNEPTLRAKLFTQLGELWDRRIGCLEEAARCYREAASATPRDHRSHLRAAHACVRAGHGELARDYTAAILDDSSDPDLRSEAQRLLAELHCKLGQLDAARAVLHDAAQEHPEASWPHLHLAALDYESDALVQAARHMSRAARIEHAHDPRRSLALYALAYGWEPDNPQIAIDYADTLVRQQHAAAAVAVLTQTARGLTGAARDDALRHAATHAQAHYRHSVAAELWAKLLYSDASSAPALAGLYECLPRAGSAAHRAALLESLLHPLAQRGQTAELAKLLSSASEALAEVLSQQETRGANEQTTRAHYASLAATPELSRLVEHAEHESARLREAAANDSDPQACSARLAQLAALRAQAGDWDGVAATCIQALALDPRDEMATARLYFAARSGIAHPTLRRKALETLSRTHEDSANTWVMLGEELEQSGDSGGALSCAQSALDSDCHAADAALLALRHLQSYPPELALPLIEQARSLLASPPAVMFAIAEIARSTGQAQRRRGALCALIELLPEFVLPRLVLLESDLEDNEASQTVADALGLLQHAGVSPVGAPLRRAIDALAERGENEAAARLAELWMAHSACHDAELAAHAYELTQASGNRSLQIVALERIACTRNDAERVRCLFQLAMRHKQAGDRVAETRTLLRAASLPEARPRALQQLATRYAELGDLPRLLMVLSQRLTLAQAPQENRKLLLDMASASVHFANDHVRAANYMRSYIHACDGDSRALLAALGALFALGEPAWAYDVGRTLALEQSGDIGAAMLLWLAHKAEATQETAATALELALLGAKRFPCSAALLLLAERLALAQGDKAAALDLYEALIDSSWGMHGRRAIYYRAGRWLERLGDPDGALHQYELAFDICCSQGVVYAAIERCARTTQQCDRLLAVMHRLIQRPANDRGRVQLYSEAVDVCLHECADPRRALILLFEAEDQVPLGALDERTLEIANQLDGADDDSAITLHELVRTRAERVQQLWEVDSKADALFKLAKLQELACHDPSAAALTLEPLISGELASELSPEKRELANDQYTRLRGVA